MDKPSLMPVPNNFWSASRAGFDKMRRLTKVLCLAMDSIFKLQYYLVVCCFHETIMLMHWDDALLTKYQKASDGKSSSLKLCIIVCDSGRWNKQRRMRSDNLFIA